MIMMTMEMGPPNHDNEQHTTCLQPHEQLLMGWIMDGMTMMMGRPP
jgi:hypothetical protein